jgi:hypothetical protein
MRFSCVRAHLGSDIALPAAKLPPRRKKNAGTASPESWIVRAEDSHEDEERERNDKPTESDSAHRRARVRQSQPVACPSGLDDLPPDILQFGKRQTIDGGQRPCKTRFLTMASSRICLIS